MILKPYKIIPAVCLAFLSMATVGAAQDLVISVNTGQLPKLSLKAKVNIPKIEAKVEAFANDLDLTLNDMSVRLSDKVKEIIPQLTSDVNLEINTDDENNTTSYNENAGKVQKFKSYSKSYPIDGNDQIKLSNEYGRIVVNTWDRHEVKVDVQIKAEADNESDAQKLLDGVQITDNKEGDLVSFRTQIERNANGGWKLWNFGNGKKHKVEINYTVYMPARTDLNVEDSYGAIQLPDLSGRVKITSSYGSVSAENLSNPANQIEGSYGSLKVGSLNGARLDFSYGSVDLDECNNLKADLSYGSFKLGRLKGTGDIDLSYVGAFKIDELTNSFKKLKVDASYSGVTLGVPDTNNFDFDITTSYGGFNYNDNRVIFTSKPDTKHAGSTRNYKGHFGKGGSEAQIVIHTNYGGVNFE